MQQITDLRIGGYVPLVAPRAMKAELPMTAAASNTVVKGREGIEGILKGEDKRLLVIVGPCSIHDENSALEYAERLNVLGKEVEKTLHVVMRVYFEKPRTSVGWKGLINDPHMDGSCDIQTGLRRARKLLLKINEMGMPAATELLETITPQYVDDLVSWAAIGARTTESQTHREMASGLSMAVGFKNATDGNLSTAINAMVAARAPQSFLGIDQDGQTCIVNTNGNNTGHVVLRGGRRPNYDALSIEEARLELAGKNLPEGLMVDCSHANSKKKFQGQAIVWKNTVEQYIHGNDAIIGLMLESHLHEGNQKFSKDLSQLEYGVSITDECISWETTETLIHYAHEKLGRQRHNMIAYGGSAGTKSLDKIQEPLW
ncbi:MAG: 3-deoxy-7-phosphoheptulonate synthase [Deltaproteobacteria bacterium]|nr:3-deoxy-7-phosphoheptulonate synthase [Deltaproteobacteria bacterium]MBW2297725.1 3-deoxy-7-phosphoheptulonate synthase [Deltaproteobacteria bacterium]MBW2611286.1 3-deoxy-7-phosphoheptulonate synthase [Deltaproteobacteria bacterium]